MSKRRLRELSGLRPSEADLRPSEAVLRPSEAVLRPSEAVQVTKMQTALGAYDKLSHNEPTTNNRPEGTSIN